MTSEVCRLCLNENKIMFNMFTHKIKDLPEIILKCTAIQIMETDRLPCTACEDCIQTIMKFNVFRIQCHYVDQLLRQQHLKLENNAKNTSTENDIQSKHLSMYNNMNEEELDEKSLGNNNSKMNTIPTKSCIETDYEDSISDCSNSSFNDPDYRSIDYNYESMSILNNSRSKRKYKTKMQAQRITNIQNSLLYNVNDYSTKRKVKVYQVDDSIREIIGNNVYICDICLIEFQSFFHYYDHQETHNGQFVFKCDNCTKMFNSRQQLVEHDSRHKIPCNICKLEVLPKSMAAHLLIHTDIHKCLHCGTRHTSKASLEKHIKARHAGIKGFVCHICGKQNSCQSSMKRHMAYHSTERPYKCKYCNFCAKSTNIVQVHTSRKHFAEKCICEICAKLFKSQPSLIQHMKRIHTTRKHTCDICGKTFIERYNLNRHLKRHAGQRIHECKVCRKEFFTVRLLKEHMHSHRQGCVNCPKCGKEFFYKTYYTKHVLKCTKTDTTGDNDNNKIMDLGIRGD